MNHRKSWRSLTAVLLTSACLPGLVLAQAITSIEVQPPQACAGSTVSIRLNGVGACMDVRVDLDPGGATIPMSGSLPLVFTATFDDPDTYTLRVQTTDANCNVTAPDLLYMVNDCPVPGLHTDPVFTEVFEVEVGLAPAEEVLTSLVPSVTAYYGVVQPGDASPFLIFGERLPLKGEEQTGEVFLGTAGGLVKLTVDEWSTSGTWGAVRVPEWVSGLGDHTALLWARSAAGWESPWLAVEFTAAREVKLLPREDIDLVSCGTDANFNCCVRFSEGEGTYNPWSGDVITPGCLRADGATFEGSHFNDWGAVGDDTGTDTYRVELANGWVIERIELTSSPSEAGEANASRSTLNSPAGHSTWDESINWWVTPNDDIFYHGRVFITGPSGTSHK